MQVTSVTPKSKALAVVNPQIDVCPTIVTGDPAHDNFALRRLAITAANDSRNLLADHKDMMGRLSARAPAAARALTLPLDLPVVGESLLRMAVEQHTKDFVSACRTDPEGHAALKEFLGQPRVQRAATWNKSFRAQPPRGAVARIARASKASLHTSVGYWNYCTAHGFKQEVRRLVRWYRPGRRKSRWHRGIVRHSRGSERVRGVRSAMSSKVNAHFKRLLKPLRVEGMLNWSKAALAIREAGVPVQSGTVAVERLWATLLPMLPQAATRLSSRWFRILAQLTFVRYNYTHFSARDLPGFADRDPRLAQRVETMCMLAEAAGGVDGHVKLDHLQPLFDPFTQP